MAAEPPMSAVEQKEKLDHFFNDERVPDAPAEDLCRILEKEVKEHARRLGTVREALSDSLTEAWDAENDTIEMDMEPFDRSHIGKMITTDNQQFNKVMLVFGTLCAEMHQLSSMAEGKFFGQLTMFGHVDEPSSGDEKKESKGEKEGVPNGNGINGDASAASASGARDPPEMAMGNFLSFAQDLSNYITRCYNVVKNTIHQLACLYHERQKLYISTFKDVDLSFVFEAIGELARALITIDAIIEDNKEVAAGWSGFKRMVKYVRAEPSRYNITEERLRTFEALCLSLERKVFSAAIFEGLIAQDYGFETSKALVAGNRVLAARFGETIAALQKRLMDGIGDPIETHPRHKLVELFGLYALFRRLFKATNKPDKNMFKELWAIQKAVPVVVLFGRAVWFIADFLSKYAPLSTSSLNPAPTAVVKTRLEYLRQLDDDFERKTEEMYLHMVMWMVRIESELVASSGSAGNAVATVLNARSKLLLNGILLANQVRNMITTCLHLHLLLETPFVFRNIRSMAICAEMLKAIQYTYHRSIGMIGENISHMLGQTTFALKRIFVPIKRKLEKKNTPLDETKLDVLAAVNMACSLLDGTPTPERQALLNLSLAVAQMKKMLKPEASDEVRYQLWKLNLLSSWQANVKRITNCSFLYWVTSLVPAFFEDIYDNPDQINRLQYLFAAFRDSNRLLVCAQPNVKERCLRSYKNEVLSHFTDKIVNRLSRAVETDLRYHIHSVVLQQESLRTKEKSKDLARFLDVKPLRFFDMTIDIKARVTHYLDSTFYNLTTVALHDWRIYAEMRNLAYEKYGLSMTEVHLPGSSHYSDNLDVLEIMRNIHIFVSRYNYNMNTQIFMERAFDQKHLNSINIHHIAQSIRTHGTGIMNTTVNFTYQFLCRKFVIFSEFLFDDHIKSRLMKDIRYFKTEKDTLDQKYPFDRADKFNRDIRKLGVGPEGQTFLDQFRQQITEIGNALGYVRMVRSGGLHYCSEAIKFVPDLEDIESFSTAVALVPNLPDETKQAAKTLDSVLEDLSKNLGEGTDYFQVLVDIFKNSFRTEEQKHLRNFFIIVGPLTLNYVEKMIGQKERLQKKGGKQEAAFTDDGFALGLAYILKLLGQDEDFDSLHWFDSVMLHINKRRQEISDQKSKSSKRNEEDMQHFQLTSKRLASLQLEFELLFYSFTGARIFFRDANAPQQVATGVDGATEVKRAPADATPSGAAAAVVAGDASSGAGVPVAPPMGAPMDAPPMEYAGAPPAPPL